MTEKFCDSTLLDKAISFATTAHKNAERRGKGFPYITHPLAVMGAVTIISNDQELMAAALLHDVVEDTDIGIDVIKKEFGERIANIVSFETEPEVKNVSLEDSWQARKQAAIDRLKGASYDCKVVALADKYSNIKDIYFDYLIIGDKIWDRFHEKDPKVHEWRYRELAKALADLSDTVLYQDFVRIIDLVFKK